MAELVEQAIVKALTRSYEKPRVGWYYPSPRGSVDIASLEKDVKASLSVREQNHKFE